MSVWMDKRGGYRDDVRELNSRKSPTARKILLSEVSREARVGVDCDEVEVGVVVEVMATLKRRGEFGDPQVMYGGG